VEFIVGESLKETFFASDLWKETPRILKYGEKAIKLRKEVNQVFVEKENSEVVETDIEKSNKEHAYFIEILEQCHKSLYDWFQVIKDAIENNNKAEIEVEKQTSQFTGLEIAGEDDQEELENEDSIAVDYDLKLLDEKDTISLDDIDKRFGELRMSILCMLFDLENAHQKVANIWTDVKNEKRSIYTAVMVTYLAMKEIQSLNNQMQMLYPAYRTAFEFTAAVSLFLSEEVRDEIEKTKFFKDLFALILDLEVLSTTPTRSTALDENRLPKNKLYSEDGNTPRCFDESFSSSPDPLFSRQRFLQLEYPNFYNFYFIKSKRNFVNFREEFNEFPLINIFIASFYQFCDDGIATLAFTFNIQCWLTIVSILSNHKTLFMRKTNYLSSELSYQLSSKGVDEGMEERYQQCNAADEFMKIMENRMESIPYKCLSIPIFNITANNPYLHAAAALSSRLLDLELNLNPFSWHECSYYRSFCHIYYALRTEGFLSSPIPALEPFFRAFQGSAFRGELPKQGDYQKKYLMSIGVSIPSGLSTERDTLNQFLKFRPFKKPTKQQQQQAQSDKKSNCAQFDSKILNYLVSDDLSFVLNANGRDNHKKKDDRADNDEDEDEDSLGLLEMLDQIEAVTEQEIVENRVLSLDLFEFMIGMGEFFAHCVSEPFSQLRLVPKQILSFHNSGGQMLQQFPSMPMVQVVDRSMISTTLSILDQPKKDRFPNELRYIYFLTKEFLEFFTDSFLSSRLFLFPSTIEGIYEKIFGSLALQENNKKTDRISNEKRSKNKKNKKKKDEGIERTPPSSSSKGEEGKEDQSKLLGLFEGILNEFERIRRPEDFPEEAEDQLGFYSMIKNTIEEHPSLLSFQSTNGSSSKKRYSFPTLLDYALHHPIAHDFGLADWIIAMHGWISPRTTTISRESHLQTAILHGNKKAFRWILWLDSSQENLNYQNPIDGNTALHYSAMKNDSLHDLLLLAYANEEIVNKDGKRFDEYFSSMEMRRNYQLHKERGKDGEFRQSWFLESYFRSYLPSSLVDTVISFEKNMKADLLNSIRPIISQEDIDRAIRAEKELLDSIKDEEEEEREKKKKKKKNKKNKK
jgi:hypothetical protein